MAGGDMNLLKQAKLMRDRMDSLQKELKERIEEGTAGGGVVKVYVNGLREVMGVKIDPEAVDPEDVETLEDLVTAAVKNALERAKALEARETEKLTGGLGLPGLSF
ncbi:MAG: YbaB/EbfC family nucleoid-associated protein [Planctomycetes bacterium]|nr:YbaB/EbfC family nucleoid-associated protein [Planctomycetota bacterium]MCB9882255.1 YbaB/EbfC family nucleoid-associated protein [Planctomycetota bacterium]MCB9890735.1 YbaB/EbfC family nucleoid-associated protein [Planctomycetota bacterium]MCB9920042.1 YbaB/EbfC family nucleoid-associated protein [Planctomycetota bacterium]